MSCDIDEATEGLRMSCDVGKATEAHSPTFPPLHLRHSLFSNTSVSSPTLQLIIEPFRCFTYVTAYSPTLPSLHLRHSSFSNPSVASPTSQLILQSFFRFSHVTGSSLTSPGKQQSIKQRSYQLPCLHVFLRVASLLFILSGALRNYS